MKSYEIGLRVGGKQIIEADYYYASSDFSPRKVITFGNFTPEKFEEWKDIPKELERMIKGRYGFYQKLYLKSFEPEIKLAEFNAEDVIYIKEGK